jgi:hypothetical protein
MTRINLYSAPGTHQTWSEARKAARADRVSLSAFTAAALREFLTNRTRRLARQSEAAK